ncbi:MAG: rhodanese-like domain-containing protein [Halobacteriota archaeon]
MGKIGERRVTQIGLVSFVLLISVAFSVSAEAASISIEPRSIEAEQGDTFTINIQVDTEGAEIYGAQYVLYFDSGILNATLQTQGDFLRQDGATTYVAANIINNTPGKLEYGESRMGVERGVTNSGTLASITFEVTGTSGTSYFEFSNVILSDSDGVKIQNVTSNPGSFSIKKGADLTPLPPQPDISSIVVEEAHEMMEGTPAEIILLDVRPKAEYEAEHIDMPGVELKNIPKEELGNRLGELDKTKRIIVYSEIGSESRAASELLALNGFEHVYDMLGGIEEWEKLRFTVFRLPVPTSAITGTPLPALSPSLSPSPTEVVVSPAVPVSPTSTPTSVPEGESETPGFEVVFAITGLLTMAYFIKRRRRR